jgi:hypothetical protein
MPRMHKIGKTATAVTQTIDTLVVKFHRTNVVHVDITHGRVTLDHGGWPTYTTKARMNQAANQFALGFSVYQLRGAWRVSFTDGRPELPFTDRAVSFAADTSQI